MRGKLNAESLETALQHPLRGPASVFFEQGSPPDKAA